MTLRAPLGRRIVPVVVMAAGGLLAVAGSFLPWVRTGSRDRNSYDVFRVAGRLGFAPDGPAATAMRWWPVVPLLAAAAVVVVWWGWGRWGGALGTAAGAYGAVVGAAVAVAPDLRFVEVRAGTFVTAVGAATLLAGSLTAIVVGNGDGDGDGVRSPTDRGGSARP